jgi:protocatechuate 3,4-dioxygenase beta subunit
MKSSLPKTTLPTANPLRRKLLQGFALGGIGSLLSTLSGSRVWALGAGTSSCVQTPPQTEGPFYPQTSQVDEDADLTYVTGQTGTALGEVILIRGQVTSGKTCEPVAGALVEIWQACYSGRYNHPDDTNPAPLDPNFQYWGKATSKADGSYEFKTILPGAYPASATWMRPAHIHFKISHAQHKTLTTQLYFEGTPYLDTDQILQALKPSERALMTMKLVPLSPLEAGGAGFIRGGRFDISLR